MGTQEIVFALKDKSIQYSSEKLRDTFQILNKDLNFIFKTIFLKFSNSNETYDSFYRWIISACKNKISLGSVKFLKAYFVKGNDIELVIVMSLSDEYLASPLGISNNFDKFNWRYRIPFNLSDTSFTKCNDFDKVNPLVNFTPTEILFLDEFINLANFIHDQINLDKFIS